MAGKGFEDDRDAFASLILHHIVNSFVFLDLRSCFLRGFNLESFIWRELKES